VLGGAYLLAARFRFFFAEPSVVESSSFASNFIGCSEGEGLTVGLRRERRTEVGLISANADLVRDGLLGVLLRELGEAGEAGEEKANLLRAPLKVGVEISGSSAASRAVAVELGWEVGSLRFGMANRYTEEELRGLEELVGGDGGYGGGGMWIDYVSST
jgi:hypothetical protein